MTSDASPPSTSPIRDDIAYILPMAAFLLLTQIGVTWPVLFPVVYILKTLAAATLLILLRKHFTRIGWRFAGLGFFVGVLGIIEWVGVEKSLLHFFPSYPRLSSTTFDPFDAIHSRAMLYLFLTFRVLGPVLVVPFMEELFWRDYLWRNIIAPNDFKLASVGEWDPTAFFVVPIIFAMVHIQWLTAILWALMIGLLLLKTKSLGACIIAHATTNALLAAYVLWTHDWYFW